MTAAQEGGEWSAARPCRTLHPGKDRYPFYRRVGGPQGRFERAENLVPTGIRSRTVQPVVQSLYRLSYQTHTSKLRKLIYDISSEWKKLLLYKLFWSRQRWNASNYSTKSSCVYILIPRKLAIKYGIYIYLNINQPDELNFLMSLFRACTCFVHMCSSSGGHKSSIQPLVSSHI